MFLSSGGNIKQVERGVTGLVSSNAYAPPLKGSAGAPRQERTQIPDVLKDLDARKQVKAKVSARMLSNRQPKKVPVYDDFGEILRWKWET